jgi:arylsulfatase A-like enzyme
MRTLPVVRLLVTTVVWAVLAAPAPADDKRPPRAVQVTVDVSEVPELTEWADKARALVEKWHPLIADLLQSDGFTPPAEVKLVFKKKMRGIAYSSGRTITIAAAWLKENPGDYGMVVHELTHVIQAYRRTGDDAGWLVEGIADYVRFFRYEPGTKLGRLGVRESYRDGYRTAARFLAWLEKTHDKDIVAKLNRALREGTYNEGLFRDWTGRGVDDLWADFRASLGGAGAGPGGSPAPRGRSPNVVIVLTDDQGYGDLGCYGARGFATPHLDRMAREGVRFTDFYVAQPVCSASRAALLTGCYPNRIGILGALNPSSKHGISANEKTIADVLKPRGYATAIYGKWHLGHHPPFLPTSHGFDDYFGLPYSNDMWPRHPTDHFPDLPLFEGEKVVATNPDQSKLTTWYTEHAVQFIAKNRDRPFFLYVAHAMPHVPLHVSDKFKGKSKQGLYGDVIMELDWSVGQILAALKQNRLDERTLVVFTADNGPWLSYGDHAGSAAPLREGKMTTWEGGVREPCLMRWPGKIPAGIVCRQPVMTIDVLPTVARLAGAELPPPPIDGLDVWSLLSGQPGARSPHDAFFFYWERELQAVRGGRWKLHFPHTYISLDARPAGHGGEPAKYEQAETPLALYDLEKDPGERTNVADEHPEEVARLKALADRAREDLGDSATKREGKGVRPPGRVE